MTIVARRSALKDSPLTVPVNEPTAAWHLLLGWVISIPLLFFATDGTLIPETGAVAYRATATEGGGGSAAHQLGLAIVFFICGVLIFSRLSAVSSVSQRMKTVVAYPILALVSSVWSLQPQQSIISGVILLLFTLFALYFGTSFETQRQFELLVLAGGLALALSIMVAVFMPAMGAGEEGWRGIFGHKQNCAGAATLLLITGIHWRPSGIYQRMFRVIYVLMCYCVDRHVQIAHGLGPGSHGPVFVGWYLVPAKTGGQGCFVRCPVSDTCSWRARVRGASCRTSHSVRNRQRPNIESAHHHLGRSMERDRSTSSAGLWI